MKNQRKAKKKAGCSVIYDNYHDTGPRFESIMAFLGLYCLEWGPIQPPEGSSKILYDEVCVKLL